MIPQPVPVPIENKNKTIHIFTEIFLYNISESIAVCLKLIWLRSVLPSREIIENRFLLTIFFAMENGGILMTSQSPKNPLFCSYLQVQDGQGRVIFPTWSSSRMSDNKSDFIFLCSCDGFWPISLYWSYKITSRDPEFNDMQPRFMQANHGIE